MRNDQEIQDAARNLFEGIAPERRAELAALWAKYAPRFSILEDLTGDGPFILEAGAYRDVHFNHRVMRAFWLAAFAAWEGYRAIMEQVTGGTLDLAPFGELIQCVEAILAADDPEAVSLPNGIPEPGTLPDKANAQM